MPKTLLYPLWNSGETDVSLLQIKNLNFLWVSFYHCHCHHHTSFHLFSFIQPSVIWMVHMCIISWFPKVISNLPQYGVFFFFFLFSQASLLHWGVPGGSDGKESNFLEKNVMACHQYWPLLDSEPVRVGKLGRCSILDLRALVTLKTSYLFGWAACGILVPLLGIKPVLSALEEWSPTTGPPANSLTGDFFVASLYHLTLLIIATFLAFQLPSSLSFWSLLSCVFFPLFTPGSPLGWSQPLCLYTIMISRSVLQPWLPFKNYSVLGGGGEVGRVRLQS